MTEGIHLADFLLPGYFFLGSQVMIYFLTSLVYLLFLGCAHLLYAGVIEGNLYSETEARVGDFKEINVTLRF